MPFVNALKLGMVAVLFLGMNLARADQAANAALADLPLLEGVEIYATRVQRRPVRYEYSLDFASCKENNSDDWKKDWKLETEVVEPFKDSPTAPEEWKTVKYAILTVRALQPLNCKSKFRQPSSGTKVSIPLKEFPQLDKVLHYFVVNSGQVTVTYED